MTRLEGEMDNLEPLWMTDKIKVTYKPIMSMLDQKIENQRCDNDYSGACPFCKVVKFLRKGHKIW